jgi:hypothetical protein
MDYIWMDYQLYISGTIVLHIECIFSWWMHVLPREKKQALPLWRCSVVSYDPSYIGFYLDSPTLKACAWPENSNQHRDIRMTIYI